VDVFPAGIDPNNVLDALHSPLAQEKMEDLRKSYEGKKLIVCRDRIEYIKGIPHKLKAFETFLTRYPEWQGKVILFLECRVNTNVHNDTSYKALQDEIEQLVGKK
jgi:trehalose 6-phosphate synthase/phosphatase